MKRQRKFWKIVCLLSLTGIVVILGMVEGYLYQEYREEMQYRKLQDEAGIEEGQVQEGRKEEPITKEKKKKESPVDFAKLSEQNPELYAWICIPDTRIDYPIACHQGEDSFYLNHDLYGNPSVCGCIYTEKANSLNFTDPNTVIYGHNVGNGTMFQNLHLFEDSAFFAEHPYVYIYTPDKTLVYEIFASYSYDDRHLLNSFDFSDSKVWEQYLEDIKNVRAMDKNLRSDVEVTPDDRIITLETCNRGRSGARYLVQAVLLQEE